MGTPKFYVAPCWSTARTLTDDGQGEKQHFVIALFGEVFDLADGLAHMDGCGWRLLWIQPNGAINSSCPHDRKRPEYFYLFGRAENVRVEKWEAGCLARPVNVMARPEPTPPLG